MAFSDRAARDKPQPINTVSLVPAARCAGAEGMHERGAGAAVAADKETKAEPMLVAGV